MAEKTTFRDNLEHLSEIFGDKEMLTRSDVCRGLKMPRRAVENMLAGKLVGGKYISVVSLARLISW